MAFGKIFYAKFNMRGFLRVTTLHSEGSMWTFTPLTATHVSIPTGSAHTSSTRTVAYTVTNQASRLKTLEMTPVPGITQITTAGKCGNPFPLAPGQSCRLELKVSSSELQGNVAGGSKIPSFSPKLTTRSQ